MPDEIDDYSANLDAISIMHLARRCTVTLAESAIVTNVIDYIIGIWCMPMHVASEHGLLLVRQHCERTQIWQAALGITDNE